MSLKTGKTVRIGACTMLMEKGEKRRPVFYDKLFALCEQVLPDCGCDAVLLPERSGFRDSERGPLDEGVGARFAELARTHGLYLIAPIAELDSGKTYNTQAIYSPEGKAVFRYRKVQLAPGEQKTTTPGNEFGVYDLPWFRAGIVICYDNQFPEPARCLAVQGAQVLFFPSYGNVKHPIQHGSRCVDNHIYMVGAGIIDRDCGLSDDAFEVGMLMDPNGAVLVESPAEEGLVVCELPLDPATGKLNFPEPEQSYLPLPAVLDGLQ